MHSLKIFLSKLTLLISPYDVYVELSFQILLSSDIVSEFFTCLKNMASTLCACLRMYHDMSAIRKNLQKKKLQKNRILAVAFVNYIQIKI